MSDNEQQLRTLMARALATAHAYAVVLAYRPDGVVTQAHVEALAELRQELDLSASLWS